MVEWGYMRDGKRPAFDRAALTKANGAVLLFAIHVETVVNFGMSVGYTETEAASVVLRRLDHARKTGGSDTSALERARRYFATVTPAQHRDGPPFTGLPWDDPDANPIGDMRQLGRGTSTSPVYLGWPLHSRSFAAETSRLSLALRLAFDQAGLYRALDWTNRVLARIDRRKWGWRRG